MHEYHKLIMVLIYSSVDFTAANRCIQVDQVAYIYTKVRINVLSQASSPSAEAKYYHPLL